MKNERLPLQPKPWHRDSDIIALVALMAFFGSRLLLWLIPMYDVWFEWSSAIFLAVLVVTRIKDGWFPRLYWDGVVIRPPANLVRILTISTAFVARELLRKVYD